MVIILAAAGAASGLDPAWIAFLGAAFGGAGLKITETWLGRNKVKIDDATQIRDELRTEITTQREEIKALEAEVHKWREEYYSLRDKYLADIMKSFEDAKNAGLPAAPTDVRLPIPPVAKPLTDKAPE